MNEFNNIYISLAFNWIFLLLGLFLITLYTWYNYKFTIPVISKSLKNILIFIRTAALFIILSLIFEPKLFVKYENTVTPSNYIFADNSSSIISSNSIKRSTAINTMLEKLKQSIDGTNKLFIFSKVVSNIPNDSLPHLKFDGANTNFENIFTYIDSQENKPSTITIISDGIINGGKNPYYSAEKLSSPIFTVGVGDTLNTTDILIQNIECNKFLYSNEPTSVKLTITNTGLSEKKAKVSFYENNKFISYKYFTISSEGINNIYFDYTPGIAGQKKLLFKIDKLTDETNSFNNIKSLIINVLKSKLNILLIGGSPSSDYSAIKQSLKKDKKLKINEVIQISNNIILNIGKLNAYIDSSSIIYLVGFPTKETPLKFSSKIFNSIKVKNKPFLFVASKNIDFNSLKSIKDFLPFTFSYQFGGLEYAQIAVNNDETGLLKSSDNFNKNLWNSLPPIIISANDFKLKPGSFLVAGVKSGVPYPLICAGNLGGNNSLAVLGFDIWKWKIQADDNRQYLFDSFILNSVKWLNNTGRKKTFTVTANKKIFGVGEKIFLTAELYDQTFSPIDNAQIDAELKISKNNVNVLFSPNGNGFYSAEIEQLPTGIYNFKTTAKVAGKQVQNAELKIRVDTNNLEKFNTNMNKNLLKLLAKGTAGNYYEMDEISDLIKSINQFNSSNIKKNSVKKEYDLFAINWVLAVLVLFFALEWFLRKRAGMI